MKNKGKTFGGISVSQILGQFWNGIKPVKVLFFPAYIFFFIAQSVNLFVPLYYKKFFDVISKSTSPDITAPLLIHIVVIILIFHALNWIFWRVGINLFNIMESRVMARLKQNAFDYMIKHSYTFFANNFSGSLVQKVGRFSRAFESLADSLAFNLIPLVITVVGSVWITWFIAPIVSIIIAIWVIVIATFSIIFSTWKLKYDTVVAEADSRTTGYLADSVTNNTAVSFFTGHNHESDSFRDISDDQAKKTLFSWRLGDITDAVQTLLIILVEFFVFYYAIKYWSVGLITVGTFVLAQTYIIGLSQQLWGLNRIIRSIYQSLADSKQMVEILLTNYEIKDAPDAKKLIIDKGEIVFKDVSFDFGKDNEVLSNLNITIKAGEKVAIIGPSGAGKTTFVRLIMRLYNLTEGSINIDGQDISKVTQDSLRENISFVPQDPILFHRTLMENIRYGRRDASDEEVKEAAHLAHCDEFIEKLPLKYETYVGERGIKLSGGERQRVAIARAILKKAPILIFDEATSSLDSYSESLIQDALKNLMNDCTTIIIAHRLSTVKRMDRIISMDNGLIVEDGTHDELSNKDSGLYKKLWDLQVSGFM
jgi:ATP-binding cassette, subfamily B, bacterial